MPYGAYALQLSAFAVLLRYFLRPALSRWKGQGGFEKDMLKKVVVIIGIVLTIFGSVAVFAITGEEVLESNQATELLEMKESTKNKMEEYIEKYGSAPYGVTAYILNGVRIYSIPLCFIGIAVGSIFQYVLRNSKTGC